MGVSTEATRVVLVDMDAVLADFDRAVLERLSPEIDRVERQNFYIARDYPSHMDHVRAVYSHPEFFFTLEPVEGAVEGWQRLIDLGYDPRVCTAPLTLNPKSVEGKVAWLEEHLVPRFGSHVVTRAIFDKRKFDYERLVLIDDRPDIDTNCGRARWRHVVFDQPYNQESISQLRIHGCRIAGRQDKPRPGRSRATGTCVGADVASGLAHRARAGIRAYRA